MVEEEKEGGDEIFEIDGVTGEATEEAKKAILAKVLQAGPPSTTKVIKPQSTAENKLLRSVVESMTADPVLDDEVDAAFSTDEGASSWHTTGGNARQPQSTTVVTSANAEYASQQAATNCGTHGDDAGDGHAGWL